MFTETVYTSWLDQRAGQIFDKVTSHQTISNEETLVLFLKAHNDQIRQLAESMVEGFDRMDRRFEQVTSSFKWGLIAAIAFLSLLMTGLKFLF
jgi:hypothetical protein